MQKAKTTRGQIEYEAPSTTGDLIELWGRVQKRAVRGDGEAAAALQRLEKLTRRGES